MSGTSLYRSLILKIVAIPIAVFVLGGLIPAYFGQKLLLHNAERETHEKALALLQTYNAMERFVEEDAARAGQKPPPGESKSTLAAKAVMKRYEAGGKELPYTYRRVSLRSKNPANQVNEFELKLVSAFQADRNLRRIEDVVERQNGPCKVIAVPIGSPKGEIVGASVIYVPESFAQEQANAIFWTVFKIVALLAFLCVALLTWRCYGVIVKPIGRMIKTSQSIRRGEWGARFTCTFPDELAELAQSFQDTSYWLRDKLAKEEKLRAMFQQFIPASVAAKALGKDEESILAGTRHSVTVLIINIRNFHLLEKHLPPDQTVKTLNEYFSEVNRVITANRGMVSKYLGDTVMAFFGMPIGNEKHSLDAVKAALAIPPALQNVYVKMEEKHGWELGVGIGISTGEPVVGHFGSSEHMEYSVLGEVVDEARMLEEITKNVPEEDSIFISETTYRAVMSDVHVFDLGDKTGRDGRTLHAYAVQGLRSEARSVIAA